MSSDVCFLPATAMAAKIRARELSPVEIVDAFLDRIATHNDALNAYVLVFDEAARAQAKVAERQVMDGAELGPLHGIPTAIKDLFDFKAGVVNSFGSVPFAGFVPDVDATYVERLEAAGAILLGKTNTPEFGHKGATDNRLHGPTRNPFDLSRNAGGSSGGSAAALASGLCTLAQGSDAGGSIRIPAAICGVVGHKLSFGRVASVARPSAFTSHTPFIHAGPMGRTVEDVALMSQVMSGPHRRDPLSLPDDGVDFVAGARRDVAGLRVAYSPDLGAFAVDPDVAATARAAADALVDAGVAVEEVAVRMPCDQDELARLWLRQMGVLYADFAMRLAADGLDLLGDHRAELTPTFADIIELGVSQSVIEHRNDDVLRTGVYDAVEDVLERYDALLCPTVSVTAFPNVEGGMTAGPTRIEGRVVEPLIGWCLTHPINFTGHPACSVPAGLAPNGLPVGLQVVGQRFDDATTLALCAAVERVRPWAQSYSAVPSSA